MSFLACRVLCFAQLYGQDSNHTLPLPPQPPSNQSEIEAPPFTFNAVTSMVIVDLVARDKEDNPVRDLTAGDLHVSENVDASAAMTEKIASFEPLTEAVRQRATRAGGIVLGWLHPSFCPLTGAYELSYYLSPESRKDGLHHISVTSSRRGVRLFFRPGYRIAAEKAVAVSTDEFEEKRTSPQLPKERPVQGEHQQHSELNLAHIACYDVLGVTNFGVNARKAKAKSKSLNAYQFSIPESYFASLPADERNRPTQLDFSLCVFDSLGHPLRSFDGTVEARTKSVEDESLRAQGFTHTFTVDAPSPLARGFRGLGRRIAYLLPHFDISARLVVRDRNTGAMGSGEILLGDLGPDPFRSPIPEGQTTDSFGTLTPTSALAMCGDVYQLAPWTTHLPLFSELDAVAPIYATSLGVYSRFFTAGIPNITSRTEWFGVNYQGRFGVDKAGKYEFDLISDDAAKVYIDDKLIVSDDTLHSPERSRGKFELSSGAHDIRVSYFQGPRTAVALVFLVKPPGSGWRLFDTRDFPTPEEPASQRRKLPEPER